MKKITIVIVLAISIIISGQTFSVQGKLKDFADEVEQEENNNRDSSSSSFDSSDSSDSDSCVDGCMDSVAEMLAAAWFVHNMTVRYNDYPYSDKGDGKFIIREKDAVKKNYGNDDGTQPSEKPIPQTPLKVKNYYYILETGGQWALDDGSGFFAAVHGKFWRFIGPAMESRVLWDGEDYLACYALGINMALVQTNGVLIDMYIQGSLMRGVLDRTGSAYGILLSSYPGKPVTFFLRVGGISYKYITFFDIEGRLGFMINRLEIFAGYRHLESEGARLGGPLMGVRVYL